MPLRVRGRTVARTEGIPHHDGRKVHAGHTIHDDENPGIRQVAEAVIETNYKSKNKKKYATKINNHRYVQRCLLQNSLK